MEVLIKIHERSMEDVAKQSNILRENLEKLSKELEIIRRETPPYSVNEAKI